VDGMVHAKALPGMMTSALVSTGIALAGETLPQQSITAQEEAIRRDERQRVRGRRRTGLIVVLTGGAYDARVRPLSPAEQAAL